MSDRYEIQEKIGQGGIGAVYQAYDTQLKRSVAIKRMLPTDDKMNGREAADAMLKEATTLSALQHPNIVTVYDLGVDDEGPFVVMELLKGETLDQVIKRGTHIARFWRSGHSNHGGIDRGGGRRSASSRSQAHQCHGELAAEQEIPGQDPRF